MSAYDNDPQVPAPIKYPRLRRAETLGGADEIWESVDGRWSFERYGDGWCAMELINTMRRPSPGNPFPSLGTAVQRVFGPVEGSDG